MDILKGLILFGVGAAVGSVVTYYVVKDRLEATFDAETEAFIEHYKSKSEKIPGGKNQEKVDEDESPEEKKKLFEEYTSISDSYTRKEDEYTQYSTYASEEDAENSAHPDEDLSEEPETIEQYLYEEDETFEKEELYFYDGNGVLVTKEDEPVDPKEFIGDKGLYELRTFNEPMIWVRNYKKNYDYAVTRVYSSYDYMN